MSDVWDYRPGVCDYREATWTVDRDLVKYDVEACDGPIGVVDHAVTDDAGAYVVIELGPPGLGAYRLVPAGAVAALDHDARTVRLTLTRHDVEVAPDYDHEAWMDDQRAAEVREEHGRYYGERLRA